MELGLDLRQVQTLSNRQIQSMKILQMSNIELADYIDEVQMENPLLEVGDPPGKHETMSQFRELKTIVSEDRQNSYYLQSDSEEWTDPIQQFSVPLMREDLARHIDSQLESMRLPKETYYAACFVAANLDESGYLYADTTELAECAGISAQIMKKAVRIIQMLEPAGIGATDLSNCLDIQLARMAGTELHRKIVRDHLENVSRNQYGAIARALNTSEANIRAAVSLIKTLNPKPGAGFYSFEHTSYIQPDIIIKKSDEHFEILVDDYTLPNIHISAFYQRLFEESDDKELRSYINEKLQQAKWLIQCIEQRQSTLRKCAEAILEAQEGFFKGVTNRLSPLVMADIAGKVGIHESTVSRAARGKYLQCVHGVYPLHFFFSRKIGNSDASANGVKRALLELVNSESKHEPMSDQRIAEHFKSLGVAISRRTIAKYRTEMNIPNTSGRRTV
jgi:RNA polymerase sigma-54 factor